MLTLASMYRKGEGCPRDPAAALRCFQQAAEKGNPEAANELGVMFLSGEGTLPDESASAYWFQRAMELEEMQDMQMLTKGLNLSILKKTSFLGKAFLVGATFGRSGIQCGIIATSTSASRVPVHHVIFKELRSYCSLSTDKSSGKLRLGV
eukprot:symbB.v1.2.034031.t1/scaffold4320.1/size63662/4